MPSTKEILFHGLFCCMIGIGFWDMLYNYEENKCEMTYMFEYPQYLKIPISEDRDTSRYTLYLYGEGHYFEMVKNLQLQGIPVLYIPGHGGSYKQARSLGSVLLRKAIDKSSQFHFNVFTVDLNEELIAFYGGTMQSQLQFVHSSINHILSLYEQAQYKPKSVILVGHSMGGFLSRAVFSLSDFDLSTVSTVITISTPNLAPVINIDPLIAGFYERVNKYWKQNSDLLMNVTVTSISGGTRDFQVRSSISKLPVESKSHISTVATAVPGVHLSADHQCMVWCKQLVLVTTRFLFDIVDTGTKQITEDVGKKQRAMDFHFSRNPGTGKVPSSDHPRQVKLSTAFAWKDVPGLLWSLDPEEAGKGTYFSFSIESMLEIHVTQGVVRTDSKREKWALACSFLNGTRCNKATDLSHLAMSASRLKIIHLNLKELEVQGFTHILFPTSHSTAALDVNFLSDLEVQSEVVVPHIFSNIWTFNEGYQHNIVSDPERGRFYYRIQLNGFLSIYQAFKLTLNSDKNHIMRVEVSWDKGQTFYGTKDLLVKLHNTPENLESKVFMHVYMESDDPIELNIKVDFFQVLGQIIRHFATTLPVFILSNIVLTYSYQVNQMCKGEACHFVMSAHQVVAKPYKVQPFISLLKIFYGYQWFYALWSNLGLPVPDSLIFENEHRAWFAFAPFVLFMFALEIFKLLMNMQLAVAYAVSKSMNLIPPIVFSTTTTSNLVRVIIHSAVFSILISMSSSLALLYMFVCSYLNVCWLYKCIVPYEHEEEGNPTKNDKADKDQTAPEVSASSSEDHTPTASTSDAATDKSLAVKPLPRTSSSEDHFSVNFVLSQLWLWLFLFSVPSLGFHIVNMSLDPLPEDHLLYTTVCASLIFVIQSIYPSYDGVATSKVKILSWMIFPGMVLLVVFCMYSLYRVPMFIMFFLGLHTIMQVV